MKTLIFGGDPDKFLICKRNGRWVCLPPINEPYLHAIIRDSFEEVLANYLFEIGCDD